MFKLTGGQTTWLGGNDQTVEGSFQWVDGSAWDWTNWHSGEPNQAGNEDCVEMGARGEGEWNDRNCANTFPFICAIPYIGKQNQT